jgi:hypothetical protein
MRRVELTITFTDDTGAERQETQTVETSYAASLADEHRLAHIVSAELNVAAGEQAVPKHNAIAQEWLDFPNQRAGIEAYFDIQNSQAVWLELAGLIMRAEGDLILAQTFKALEPPQEPPFGDAIAINDLYYVHDRKMNLLNQSVYALIKVQDIVNRLLHESLGGDLVDTTKRDWERTQLTRANVEDGLKTKLAGGAIAQADFDAITQALAVPKNTPKAQTTLAYRNRLTHHIRPSVDYPMFFSELQSRTGRELKDAQGKVTGKVHVLLARPPIQYKFADLHAAFSEYLDAVVDMLQKLSRVGILRR